MDKAAAVEYYGSESALARALGLTQATVWGWKSIPDVHQLKVEELTEGRLMADPGIPRGWRPKSTEAAA